MTKETPEKKLAALKAIYAEYEAQAASFKAQAVCAPGCAYCCTHYGHLDMTTLEGLRLQHGLQALSKAQQRRLSKKINANRKAKEAGKTSVCPFLSPDKTCCIYQLRPFSCRQLYSLKKCGEHGPIVHPQAVELAKDTILRIQALDATGYSGHITYVLALLDKPGFYRRYVSGGFDPSQVAAFGRSHGLIINSAVLRRNSETRATP